MASKALILDVGGVLLVPSPDLVGKHLAERKWTSTTIVSPHEESLKRREICQVGDGSFMPVAAIVDSAVVRVAKPDPRIFLPALAALGASLSDALYVGDSERFDVRKRWVP